MANKYDLSILIPSRNEMFLSKTVESILKNIRGKTEVIIALDGAWADPPITDDERVTILYFPESIGQRAATNKACMLSQAKYVMKLDAHCDVDEGFDVKMMREMKDHYTMVPLMRNLHAFDWVCPKGHRRYQGPSGVCEECGQETKRDVVWRAKPSPRSTAFRFDRTMHFQYWNDYKRVQDKQGDIVDTLSLQGSCFMMTREKYWELDVCEENFGSWGQQGVEVACKTWLSGGEVKVNKKTWYAHMFRTQGGDFGFPYPLSGRQVDKARKYSRDLFQNDKWPKAKHSFQWLLDKFKPVPEWHDLTKGIVYYTDNRVNLKIGHAARKLLKRTGLPIVSVSLKPMDFGKNIVMKLERGYEAYFRQILTALENSTEDVIYLCEHDWLYPPSHFEFTPSRRDVYYYNDNWWRVRASDGHAVHYNTHLVPGLVAYRETLLDHYRNVVGYLEKNGFTSENAYKVGFEPGTHRRVDFVGKYKVESFRSKDPLIDIRHTSNLTASKWSPDAFRSPKNARGWVENDTELPYWGRVYGRFDEFIRSL